MKIKHLKVENKGTPVPNFIRWIGGVWRGWGRVCFYGVFAPLSTIFQICSGEYTLPKRDSNS